jgi:hypothetical protein
MYIFAVLFFSIFALLEVFNKEIVEKHKAVLAFTCYSFLIFHDGFRWETGTDWGAYTYEFDLIRSMDISNSSFEPGFAFLFSMVKLTTDNYSIYLILHAILFYTAFFYAIFKIANYPFISLLIFYMITVPYMGMNRQFLAMAIYAVALVFLLDNKKWSFIFCMLLGCLFHRTAILTLPILLLTFNIEKKYIIISLLICFIISASGILNNLSLAASMFLGNDEQTDKKLDFYLNEDREVSMLSTLLSLVRKIIWLSLILLFEPLIDDKDKKYYILRNIYALSILIYILFNGTALQIIVSRGLLYYNLAEMFMIPYVLTIFRQNYGKLLLMFVLIAYCFVNIYKGFSNYGENTDYFTPYKGIFINTDYVRQNTD